MTYTMMEKQPNERKRKTYEVFNRLKTKYQVDICRFDHAAITVFGITEKQFSALCGELHCSGTYNEERQTAILTNFGVYK